MRKTPIAVLFLAGVAGAILLLRIPVLEGKLLGSLRPYYTLLLPPQDLYEPVVRFDIGPAHQETTQTFAFSHRYVGSYTAGIYVEKTFSLHETPAWDARLELRCTSGGASLIVEDLGAKPSPFLGLRGNGFSLLSYQVPRDLPQGTKTQCRLRVIGGGEQLVTRFGQTEFFVAKASDL
jgi:hypothetical protein